jgi:hypothetical protein
VASNGVTEHFEIYNPGSAEADVSLAVILDAGSAEPFALKVAAHDTLTVDAGVEARIPRGVAHAAVLRSTNGVGVVAERTVDASAPSPRSGRLELLGARVAARRWVLASGRAGPGSDEWLEIFNPGRTATTVSVASLTGAGGADLSGLTAVAVPAGRRMAVHINQHAAVLDQPLLVEAGGAVVVERDVYPTRGRGLDAAMGVPLEA